MRTSWSSTKRREIALENDLTDEFRKHIRNFMDTVVSQAL